MFESGKQNLRIQKYPDTCGRGLNFQTRFPLKWKQVLIFDFVSGIFMSQVGNTNLLLFSTISQFKSTGVYLVYNRYHFFELK